jgi:hypothetical protein
LRNKQATQPARTRIQDVKAGCPLQSQLALKEVGHSRFDPTPAYSSINEEINLTGFQGSRVQGLIASPNAQFKGSLAIRPVISNLGTRELQRSAQAGFKNPKLLSFKVDLTLFKYRLNKFVIGNSSTR